jgi:protein-disulfide isomerase
LFAGLKGHSMNRLFIFAALMSLLTAGYCAGADEKSPPKSSPVLNIDQKDVNLGSIPREAEEIVGTIFLFNTGGSDLLIHNVTGPCVCFKGYDGDKLIKAGDAGQIFVRFNKSEIPAGRVRRSVYIESNDTANPKTEVGFTFTIARDPTEEEIRALKSEVAGLRREVHALSQQIQTLSTEIKNDKGNAEANSKSAAKNKIDTTVYEIEVGSSPVLGPKDAPVTIVEFTDLQCPFCAREYPTLKEILQQYTGKVRLVFKHYPLAFHTKAKPAHAAAELVYRKAGSDAFWKMQYMLLADPNKIEITELRNYAKSIGVDMYNFDKVMGSQTMMDELLKADKAMAIKCKVQATPTILVNGLKLTNRNISDYKKRIDEILTEKAEPNI